MEKRGAELDDSAPRFLSYRHDTHAAIYLPLFLDDTYRKNLVSGTNVIYNFDALNHFAETGVAAIEVLGVLTVETNEELRATCVLACMRHGENASVMILARSRGFALDAIAWPAGSVTARTSALNDKIGNDTVESESVIEVVVGQIDEIGHRSGCFSRIEFGFHVALFR